MALHTYLSIITLNVNDLNPPKQRHRVAEWIRKQDLYICCLEETHLKSKHTHRLSKGIEKYILYKGKGKISWGSSAFI